jgi:glutamate/tyrosine decarboxylase-like PLP-dependent enzyme
MYASEEVHRCVVKAAGLLGLGEENVRLTPVDSRYRADVRAMREFLALDRRNGAVPVAIIGSAGTVNTGAVDPLNALADLAAEENLWFHVDGAYGALAALAPTGQALLRGMERADSLALDPHKWLFVPYEAGAVLLRDPSLLRKAYGGAASYMREDKAAMAADGERTDLFEYGPQLSRGFRALKVWASLKAYGRRAYAAVIEEHLRLARAMDAKVLAHPNFELCSEAQLSITCFRWLPLGPRPDPEALDRIQQRLALALERSGEGFMSGTNLAGRAVLRTCILSFRTQEPDLDGLLESLDRLGREHTP